MAWTSSLTEQLRYYLNDADSTNYSDARLSKFIAISAFELISKLELTSSYTVNITVPSISPDPETDAGFSSLIVLNAAIIIIRQEIKQLALSAGYRVVDDRSSIDGSEALKAMKDLLKSYQDNYDKAEQGYLLGDNNIGRAILSPYTL